MESRKHPARGVFLWQDLGLKPLSPTGGVCASLFAKGTLFL